MRYKNPVIELVKTLVEYAYMTGNHARIEQMWQDLKRLES